LISARNQTDFSHAGGVLVDRYLEARVGEPLQDDLGGGLGAQNLTRKIRAGPGSTP